MTPSPAPLSFRPERSKAEWSGVEWSGEISGLHGTGPIVVGDLSTQSNNRFQTPLPSYRHAAPLEMTCRRPALQSWGKETNDIDTIRPTVISTKALQSGEISGLNSTSASPSHCHFDRNEAKRSGVEKSPAPMPQAPLRWEISRLKASMEFKYLYLPADTQPRSR